MFIIIIVSKQTMFKTKSIPDEFSIKGTRESSGYYLIRQLGKIIYLMMHHFVSSMIIGISLIRIE